MNSLYPKIIGLLNAHHIAYQEFNHDPIVTYDDAERIGKAMNWQGIESKNVFLKGDDDRFYVYVTIQGNKVDFKKIKDQLNVRLKIASAEDVVSVIDCVPGCVAPFGFSEAITILLDPILFTHAGYLFSPGMTTKTIQLNARELKPLFESLPNRLIAIT